MVEHLVSPRFGEGSGLKLAERSGPYAHGGVSPRFGEGSGLKHGVWLAGLGTGLVSPRFGEGSGLKPHNQYRGYR